jgi:hypothetical protein
VLRTSLYGRDRLPSEHRVRTATEACQSQSDRLAIGGVPELFRGDGVAGDPVARFEHCQPIPSAPELPGSLALSVVATRRSTVNDETLGQHKWAARSAA